MYARTVSVPTQVTGDDRDRPAAFTQRMCSLVFTQCEHAEQVSPRAALLGRLVSFERVPPSRVNGSAHGRWWEVSVIAGCAIGTPCGNARRTRLTEISWYVNPPQGVCGNWSEQKVFGYAFARFASDDIGAPN